MRTTVWIALGAAACTSAAPPQRVVATTESSPVPLEPIALATPTPTPSPTPPPRDPGHANTDPDDDSIVGPPDVIPDCAERLTRAGVRFRDGKIPVKVQPAGHSCGAPQIVIYEQGPTELRWTPEPAVTCQLALALARLEPIVQELAEQSFGTRVTAIRQGGTYACRRMARFRLVSEHSYANAIDVYAIRLADGRTLRIQPHFGGTAHEPPTPEARFLRAVAHRAFADDVFSTSLTPFWDRLHADHFHFDQGRYRVDATEPRD